MKLYILELRHIPIYIVLFNLLGFLGYSQVDTLHLNDNWQFREGTASLWQAAQVPGTVQEDLLRLGQLADPFYGTNEDSLRWVEQKDWVYRTSFSVSAAQLEHSQHKLVFHGLDTYTAIKLNGQALLFTNNMFRTWEVEVGHLLQMDNTLEIVLLSPIKVGKKYMDNLPYTLPADNDAGDIKVMPVVRKAAFHFGWDWGPRIVTSGIWRPIELLSWSELRITDFHIGDETDFRSDNSAIVPAIVSVDGCTSAELSYWVEGHPAQVVPIRSGNTEIQFQIPDAQRWWPNGQGDQPLYNLHIQLGDNHLVRRVGLRTAELVHEPDSLGTAYYFKINGRPIFAKGANYIPQSHFTNQLSKADYRRLLTIAADSHMNMIRVWGGGIYEEDYFYELCDSLGLMVWQDFMFANTIFPVDEVFNDNMLAEVEDNVRRLGYHPSIIHWCGNNEINVAWHNWGWQDTYKIRSKHQKMLYNNYKRIFVDSLPHRLHSILPSANYTHTSPLSNWNGAENFDHSSMHYWGVFHGEAPFEDYGVNIGRFNSEYGFQTFPNINVIKKYFNPQEFDLEDPLLDHRQKSYKGNRLIYQHIDDYYPTPTNLLELSYLSQLTQAKGIEMAISEHRLDFPRCMGTLYWQLNDCWPAVSWSSLDYNGQWKALHYTVVEAYQPLTIIPDVTDNTLHLINDGPTGQMVDIQYKDEKGVPLLSHYNLHLSAQEVMELPIAQELIDNHNWLEVTLNSEGDQVSKLIMNPHYSLIPIGDHNLEIDLDTSNEYSTLRLKSKVLIKDLYLFSDSSIHFSQNFFDLIPERTYEVRLTPLEGPSPSIDDIEYITINNLKSKK
jgi:beta-mannosidase